ncbi:hypothetical protein BJ993_000087 [Nocardioides aromaticivorans]|uniref:DUF3592 domain-containing protein n=1 Tax=Nocardioides aromaticivorans TaxID=200618 RepID=A0A7Z0CLL5_9ACTN|nr:hypothetical protein [Nocardioides aromaticivorans]NYI43007.1 hypothetical protein [Nocardioides aromaticivorans]
MAEPQRPPESLPMRIVVNLVVAAIMLVPFVLVGAGAWLIVQRQTGERVEAEVIGCDLDVGYKTSSQHCTARWTVDGVEHTGPIQGSGDQEVGRTVDATLRDGELYSRSLTLPLVLLGLGLPLLVLPFTWVRRRLRGARTTPAHP